MKKAVIFLVSYLYFHAKLHCSCPHLLLQDKLLPGQTAVSQYKFFIYTKSVYDMKNIFRLFERPFEIQKNGVFLFEISFFVPEILSFLYYAN